jgi:hypothetical protein
MIHLDPTHFSLSLSLSLSLSVSGSSTLADNGGLIYIGFFEQDRSFCRQQNSDFCIEEVVVNLHVQGQKEKEENKWGCGQF